MSFFGKNDNFIEAPAFPSVRITVRNFLLILIFVGATYGFYAYFSAPPTPPPKPKVSGGPIDSVGGSYFSKRVELPVKLFRQSDPRWSKTPLAHGQDGDTIGSHGCALASLAMIMLYYDIPTDPPALNRFLLNNGGYTPQGWLEWKAALALAPDKLLNFHEVDATHAEIDKNLRNGNPVIIRVRFPKGPNGEPGITHFVVVCGKEGHDYLIRDPGDGSSKGTYALKELSPKIEALRYYDRVVTTDR